MLMARAVQKETVMLEAANCHTKSRERKPAVLGMRIWLRTEIMICEDDANRFEHVRHFIGLWTGQLVQDKICQDLSWRHDQTEFAK